MGKERYDYLIKGGRLLGARDGKEGIRDVAVTGRRIARIGTIPETDARMTINAAGCVVTPGLIDFHAHLSPFSEIGVYPEPACFPSGVTTAVDAGSAGASNYPILRTGAYSTHVNVYAFLNVCSTGLATRSFLENLEPGRFNRGRIRELFRQYGRTELLGLKVRQSQEIVGELGLEPMKAALELAGELDVPLMVHITNPPCPLDELIDLLRPGDIVTHAYQDSHSTILGPDGRVSAAVRAARERGVLFDVANANAHFSFRVARAAIAEGFLPDTISTDLTNMGLFRRPNAYNLLHIMSKYLNMGLTLEQIIERTTQIPARIIGRPELGFLAEDGVADIAVFRQEDREIEYGTGRGATAEILKGTTMLRTMLTMREGALVYRDQAF